MRLLKAQYKEQQNTLKSKEDKIVELVKLTREATDYAESLKTQIRQKDEQLVFLIRQVEGAKKQLAAAQKKVKSLTGEVVVEMSKQLEGKVKEVEVLKEMLRSSKIELGGREREVRQLKARLSAQAKRPARSNIKGAKRSPPNDLTKSVANVQRKSIVALSNAKYMSVPGNNMFFHLNHGEANKVPELGDLKELELDSSIEKLKGMASINLDIPEAEMLPEIHLPSVMGAGKS